MARASMELLGADDLEEILETILPRHARNLARATVNGIAAEGRKQARANAPKDKGTLKKAIKNKRRRSPPDKPVAEVYVEHGNDVKNDAFYWHFVEYGTAGKTSQPEQPFVRPAIDYVRGNLPSIMREQFVKKLESAAKRELKKREKK